MHFWRLSCIHDTDISYFISNFVNFVGRVFSTKPSSLCPSGGASPPLSPVSVIVRLLLALIQIHSVWLLTTFYPENQTKESWKHASCLFLLSPSIVIHIPTTADNSYISEWNITRRRIHFNVSPNIQSQPFGEILMGLL